MDRPSALLVDIPAPPNWPSPRTAYAPELKFSGKPRDSESELDYFGARYYDRAQYRFLSVDPVLPAGKAVANPQRWNLYAYCLDNPVSYVDKTGADPQKITIEIVRYREESGFCIGKLSVMGADVCWTLENSKYKQEPGTYGADLVGISIKLRNARRSVTDPDTRIMMVYDSAILVASNASASGLHNCILLSVQEPTAGLTINSWAAWELLMAHIEKCKEDIARHALEAMDYIERSSYAEGPCDMFFNAMAGLEALSWMLDDWYRMQIELEVIIRENI